MSYFSLGQKASQSIYLSRPGKDCMTLGSRETATVELRGRTGLPLPLLQLGATAARPCAPASPLPHQWGPTGADTTEGTRELPHRRRRKRKVGFSDGVSLNVTSCCSRGNEDPRVAHLKEEVGGSTTPSMVGCPRVTCNLQESEYLTRSRSAKSPRPVATASAVLPEAALSYQDQLRTQGARTGETPAQGSGTGEGA